MKRLLLAIFTLVFALNAQEIMPSGSFKTKHNVISVSTAPNMLIASTDSGTVETFDLKTSKALSVITLPQIKLFFGEELGNPRVTNADSLDGKKFVILSDDTQAGRALFVYENGKLDKLFSHDDRLNFSKAYFLTPDKIILGTLGNEIKLYDLSAKKFLYSVQPYWSMLTDFKLSPDRALAFSAAESGVVYMYDAMSGKKLNEFSFHTDISLGTAYANGVLISGGADKKCGVAFTHSGEKYYLNADFPIYAVGISPSGKLAAFIKNEQNDVVVFDTQSRQIKATLKGNAVHNKINTIIFLNENDVIISANNKEILKWRLP